LNECSSRASWAGTAGWDGRAAAEEAGHGSHGVVDAVRRVDAGGFRERYAIKNADYATSGVTCVKQVVPCVNGQLPIDFGVCQLELTDLLQITSVIHKDAVSGGGIQVVEGWVNRQSVNIAKRNRVHDIKSADD